MAERNRAESLEVETSLARRTWPFLIAGLSTLVLLILVFGVALWQHAEAMKKEAMETQRGFLQLDRALGELRLQTLSTAIDVRDYMMEDSPEINQLQRGRLAERRQHFFEALDQVERLPANRKASNAALKAQIDTFWNNIDGVLGWSLAERRAKWIAASRAKVIPGRQAILDQAALISAENAAYLEQREESLRNSFEELKAYVIRGLIWVLLLAIGVSALTVWKITTLERRAQLHKQELESLSAELRHLSQALVQVQEAERKSLSRELHDEVGQMITVLRMELGAAEQRLASESAALSHVRAASTLAEQTLRSIRSLARGLRPSMLDELGVGPALQWLVREFSKHTGIKVNLSTDGSMDRVPESYRTCIYRVAQEALTNCARHAKAKEVQLELKRSGNSLCLRIEDDGSGFDVNQPATGIGLVGMKERVRELNGELTIVTGPQKGTLLTVRIPLWEEIAA
jgi:signal transduction histidine kinase